MHEEERRSGAAGLNGHHWRPRGRWGIVPEHRGQLFDRRTSKQRGERQVLAECLLDLCEQAYGQQRVTAELKEVVSQADRTHAQDSLPNACEFLFDAVTWCG